MQCESLQCGDEWDSHHTIRVNACIVYDDVCVCTYASVCVHVCVCERGCVPCKFSTLTTPFNTTSVSEAFGSGGTMPGQSIRKILLMRVMYCHTCGV